ncbi:hypothetical protein [Nocardia sp. NPDC057668]|uniref:DUF7373 family lipoprotein n=1 Tax=Nocardia sp. NPDC057668 TaxID=3346202 RepID=UPI00366F337C
MFSRRIRHAAAVTLTGLALAGCTVAGSATPGETDVRGFDVGKYATGPLEERYAYNPDLAKGLNLALMRLANRVVTGPEIDARFKYGTGMIPFLTPDKATKVLADVTAPVLARNNLKFGVAVGHSEQEPIKGAAPAGSPFTTVTVMQFPDDASAARAATELDEADFAIAAEANQHVTLPKYPAALAHWRPGVASMGATIARGSYVVALFVGTRDPEQDQLTALVEQVLDVQLPLLDALRPLDTEAVLRQPYDPDGMLRQTLNIQGIGQPDVGQQAVFEQRAYLHRVANQAHWRQVLQDNGVDRFAVSGASFEGTTILFRTRDADAAIRFGAAVLSANHAGPAEAPAGVPDTTCGEAPKDATSGLKRYRCVVAYRQYVAAVQSDQITDVHQRAAAQYALMANSSW